MQRIRNKYNPELPDKKATELLENVSKSEYQGWLEHPCTTSLKYTLEASLDRLVIEWVKGGFSDKTIEGASLNNARAIGMSSAIEEVIYEIDHLLDKTHREQSVYEEALYNP